MKRVPSIIKKIKINEKMNLSRMQDVAGLRVVVADIKDVYNLNDKLIKSEKAPNFKSNRVREYDYIKDNNPGPKESGYRSLHIVYQYEDKKFNKINVEIQIRTKLHHAWATSVEIMGAYLKQPLKQSFGDKKILELFKKISTGFKLLEENKKDALLAKEIELLIEEEKLIDRLKGFKKVTENISGKGSGKYFLIQLNFDKRNLVITRFSESGLDDANKKYIELEQKYKENNNMDIVLVSVNDIKKLKEMYPNYFLDADEFIKYLKITLKEIN